MKLILILEDGTTKEFGIGDSVQSDISSVHRSNVKTIVFGEINKARKVVWEKQFNPVSVMPTSFRRRS